MEKEFLEKFKEFLDRDGFIRKEVFTDGGKRKVVAFAISGLDCAIKRGEGFIKKSDEILEKEKESFDEKIVLYEWQGSDFDKIENIRNQNWFKI